MKKTIAKSPGKKSGKTKASVNKASLQKLANKKNNRLAKQGKLNKGEKKKKKIKAKQELANKKNLEKQAEENKESHSENEDYESESSEPEDVELFKHLQNARKFASLNLESNESQKSRGKKRKRNESDEEEEEEYEKQTRTFSEDKEKDMKMMLPIISKGKVIKRMGVKEEFEESNAENGQEDSAIDEEVSEEQKEIDDKKTAEQQEEEDRKYLATLTAAQQFAFCRKKLEDRKQTIAALSQSVLEDPQANMRRLKELRLLLGCQDAGVALSVRKFAMVSLTEVFKDIVPGYRLRVPTEKERSQRVKKETKTLWDYEASFLLNYKVFLDFLETMAKGKRIMDRTFLTKHGIAHLQTSKKASSNEFGKLALKCLCEMLKSHPHFNYRDNVIVSIIPFTNHENKEYSDIACGTIKSIFKQDKQGDLTLEIVRAIGRTVKKRLYDLQPKVLETFLVLKIKEVDLSGIEEQSEKMKRKEKMMKYSRRERKRLKQKEQLDRELLETKASADKKKRLKLHTEVITAVFEIYIRVIKQAPDSDLLPPVLEGLAKFAHLINLEYFDSLFAALNGLIESGDLTTRESLHCIQTAFTILSGQGSVLTLDPSRFYKLFYCAITPVHAEDHLDTLQVVLQCLEVMINKRRKHVSAQRILAFIKRLATLSLQQSGAGAAALLAAVRQFTHMYKVASSLYDSEAWGSGIYLPYLEDPEHCGAASTRLWELHTLTRHFDPCVRRVSHHVLQGAPLTGPQQLPHNLARSSPEEIYTDLKKRDNFHSLPEKSPRKKRRPPGTSSEFVAMMRSLGDEVAELLEPDSDAVAMDTS